MGVKITQKGNFYHTETFLKRVARHNYYKRVDDFARMGVQKLKEATPVDTGQTAASWDYEIITTDKSTMISWTNSRVIEGYYYGADGITPLVTILVNGHATKSGYWIPPNDFVTPTIEPIINQISNAVWSEVTR